MTFHDAHVPGAVSKATMHGALDILVPSNAKFHSLDVDIATLDLRTIQYLFPSFPRLAGHGVGNRDARLVVARHALSQREPRAPRRRISRSRISRATDASRRRRSSPPSM